jgi:putative membrane protein
MQKSTRIFQTLALPLVGALLAAGAAQAHAAQEGARPSAQGAAPSAVLAAPAKLDDDDRDALINMAQVNMAEVSAGKLAISKAVNPEIKAYAQRMVDEHSKTLAEVQALAQAKGVELPTELNLKFKAKGLMLQVLSGDVFDRTYLRQVGRRDHRVAHEQLKEHLDEINDPDIQALALKMRPVVEQHLLAADALIARTSRGATGTSGTPGKDTSTFTGEEPTPMKK